MANDLLSLGSALHTTLYAAATVPVYDTLAQQGSSPPYCVYQRQDGLDSYTFGTATAHGVSADYLVKVISNRQWPQEAREIYTHIHDIMQDGAHSVSGYQLLQSRRTSTVEYQDRERHWHVGGIYRVDIWET
jgi:hypothetical protein